MQGKTLVEFWQDAKHYYRERKLRGSPELSTGINFVDDLTDGLHKGEVWTIAGKSGGGKTSLALMIANNIAKIGKRVLFISLEMKGEELISRLFCEMKDYDNNLLRIGEEVGDFANKDKDFTAFLKTSKMEIAEYGYTPQEIEKLITEYFPTTQPDLIVIDFAQLIDREGKDDRLALEEFMRRLTELAKVKNMAILLVSQFRRPPTGADINRPHDITDLKGTGNLEQLSHVVILIGKIIEQTLNFTTTKWIINIAKNRNGAVGNKEFDFEGKYFRFKERDDFQTGKEQVR